MRRLQDVRCADCKTVFVDELCDDDFRCTCGGATTTFYGAREMMRSRKADNFSTIVFGGERYESREDWERCRQTWAAVHGETLEVVGDDPKARKVALEESHHRNIREAKRRGMHHVAESIERAGARIR